MRFNPSLECGKYLRINVTHGDRCQIYCYNLIQKMNQKLLTIHQRPLPMLSPLPPPADVVKQLKQQVQISSLTLSAVPEEQLEQDETSHLPYKQLYEEKCELEAALRGRCKSHEQIIKILQEKNASLEREVTRLQEERWKKFDYSRLSARGRSKSQRRMPPTIDVKVPKRMHQNKQILIDEEKFIKTDRDVHNEEMEYYQLQIKDCREENKQLKHEIQALRLFIKEQSSKAEEQSREENIVAANINKSKTARSPHKGEWMYPHNTETPIISPFSPYPKESSETVKKELTSYDEPTQSLKKLKNEMMYKDLLLDKLRTDHAKQNALLKKHLALSVAEGRKITEQTTSVFNSFKAEIIRLSQELLEYKRGKSFSDRQQSHQIGERPNSEGELLNLLKVRRREDPIL